MIDQPTTQPPITPTAPPSYQDHPAWPELARAAQARLEGHGDYERWRKALLGLPDLVPDRITLEDPPTAHGNPDATTTEHLRAALMGLHPWRKGPFELFGVKIDTEWRSDWKWQRVAPALGDLSGQSVLDVGCGNGYFGWRLLAAGASEVLGVDPSVLFFLQHLAISRYLNQDTTLHNHLLPVPFEDLPPVPFDLVMSMGVIYHRPDPADHISRLIAATRPGGRLLLESLVVESGDDLLPSADHGRGRRYARMRNVSIVPSVTTMTGWLADAGLEDVEVIDIDTTGQDEQRSTPWMHFESLAESLDPDHPERTVEGYPAPVRAAVLARKPC